ncbi:MAG: hypothetical protein V3U85_01185 [Hyphomicrobium sp.]
MPGRYGPADVQVTLEDAPGGTARDISNAVLNGVEVAVIARQVQYDGLGEAWEKHCPTGKKGLDPITLEGVWDTTALTGSHIVLKDVDDGPQDVARELIVDFGDSKTMTVGVRLQKYTILAKNEDIQRFRADLQPTDTATQV